MIVVSNRRRILLPSTAPTAARAPAPMSLIDYVGLPLKEGLPLVVDKLHDHGLRQRIKVIASGKLITPAEGRLGTVRRSRLHQLGARIYVRPGLHSSLQCNKNTCPTGITTHDKSLTGRSQSREQGRAGQLLCQEHGL